MVYSKMLQNLLWQIFLKSRLEITVRSLKSSGEINRRTQTLSSTVLHIGISHSSSFSSRSLFLCVNFFFPLFSGDVSVATLQVSVTQMENDENEENRGILKQPRGITILFMEKKKKRLSFSCRIITFMMQKIIASLSAVKTILHF